MVKIISQLKYLKLRTCTVALLWPAERTMGIEADQAALLSAIALSTPSSSSRAPYNSDLVYVSTRLIGVPI